LVTFPGPGSIATFCVFPVIVSWYNEKQGNITGFDNQTFSLKLNIPIGANQWEGDGSVVTSLLVAQTTTSAPGEVEYPPVFYNFTNLVAGTVLQAGETFVVDDLSIEINLAVEQEYNFLITLTTEGTNGRPCTGSELLSFTAGGSPAAIGVGSGCPEL
jgi:hypothetical protein